MAAPTKFKSNDAGAPTLSGTAGALLGVLDFCLVTGLGWTKPFTATNKAVYRAPSGVRHYLDVDDTGTTTCQMRGYETMSAVATGTGPFPTTTQVGAGSASFNKSITADGTARPWMLFGDDRTFYLFVGSNSTTFPPTNFWLSFGTFGEFVSVLTGDNYRTILNRTTQNMVVSGQASSSAFGNAPRTYVGASAQSVWISNTSYGGLTDQNGNVVPTGSIPFPNPADGGLYLAKTLLIERTTAASAGATGAIRGRQRGQYMLAHAGTAFAEADTFDGIGEFAGRSFYIAKLTGGNAQAIETTAWDVSA